MTIFINGRQGKVAIVCRNEKGGRHVWLMSLEEWKGLGKCQRGKLLTQ